MKTECPELFRFSYMAVSLFEKGFFIGVGKNAAVKFKKKVCM